MPNGGARPGAGRKPKAALYESDIRKAERKIRDHLPEIVDADIQLALGVWVEEDTEDGPRVYRKPPDHRAASYLMDRLMGKPTDRVEHSGKDGNPIPIKFVEVHPPSDPSE